MGSHAAVYALSEGEDRLARSAEVNFSRVWKNIRVKVAGGQDGRYSIAFFELNSSHLKVLCHHASREGNGETAKQFFHLVVDIVGVINHFAAAIWVLCEPEPHIIQGGKYRVQTTDKQEADEAKDFRPRHGASIDLGVHNA